MAEKKPKEPCNCPNCCMERAHAAHFLEQREAAEAKRLGKKLARLPRQNAPSTYELQ